MVLKPFNKRRSYNEVQCSKQEGPPCLRTWVRDTRTPPPPPPVPSPCGAWCREHRAEGPQDSAWLCLETDRRRRKCSPLSSSSSRTTVQPHTRSPELRPDPGSYMASLFSAMSPTCLLPLKMKPEIKLSLSHLAECVPFIGQCTIVAKK